MMKTYNFDSQWLLNNPPISAMPFYNKNASETDRKTEASLFAGQLVKFLVELGVSFEDGYSAERAFSELLAILRNKRRTAQDIVTVLDNNFQLKDV